MRLIRLMFLWTGLTTRGQAEWLCGSDVDFVSFLWSVFVWRQVRLSSLCFFLVSTGLHAFVFLRHVGLTLGRTRSTWTHVRNTRRFVCVPRAPPSKTAFDTVNTKLHRRVRCAALGPITKSSQRQRNCVLTAPRHTAKTKTAAAWRNSHVRAHGHTSTKQTKDPRRSLGHWHLSWVCWKKVTCYFLARLE